jgi:uncharacterized protein (DUF305 family)
VRWSSAAVAALTVLALAGCGGDAGIERATPQASSPDDAFVVRFYQHQQTGAELVRTAGPELRGQAAKRLVKPMQEQRERTLARLDAFREQAGNPEALADLGVAREQTAEDVTPAALEGVRPITPAFLATMVRHDDGAVALLRAELEHGKNAAVKALARQLLGEYIAELEALNRAIAQQTA